MKFEEATKNILRESKEIEGTEIKGYDFEKGIDYEKIIDSYASTGAQASKLANAIEIIKKMRKDNCTIYLGYTSNMVTSGLRDVFRFLVEHKMVDVIVTTAGGIEEDIIKCLGPFILGDFNLNGEELRDKGINRAGNMLIPNNRYVDFEKFMQPLLNEVHINQKENKEFMTPSKLIAKMGEKIDNKESIYYWANKNNIPVFCPAITDGALGDQVYFYTFNKPDFKLDVAQDMVLLNNLTLDAKKTGIIILGSGVIKHHICNANMFRNGADYAVYINNSQEFDASDSGARPEEAVSWGKIGKGAETVKVFGDATILFPIIVAKTFAKEVKK